MESIWIKLKLISIFEWHCSIVPVDMRYLNNVLRSWFLFLNSKQNDYMSEINKKQKMCFSRAQQKIQFISNKFSRNFFVTVTHSFFLKQDMICMRIMKPYSRFTVRFVITFKYELPSRYRSSHIWKLSVSVSWCIIIWQ